jgi:multiple sugar transport system substrate-binding protein
MKKRWWLLCGLLIGLCCFQVAVCNGAAKTVTIRVMDWSDSTKAMRDEFHKNYMQKHPNIKIEYTQLTIDQYKNTILTAVASNDVPDLFPVPVGITLAAVVGDGWFQPLDRYIDKQFTKTFVDGTFIDGTTMVGGKIYSLPENMSLPSTVLFYNKKLFKAAGLDPNKPPKTYSQFREYAKKITQAGKGQFYGVIEGGKQVNRWNNLIRDWSALGGSGLVSNSISITPASLLTGKANYDTKGVLDVFNLYQKLAKDKSIHPSTMSLSAPEARALFGQGQAGFIVQGCWCITPWHKDNPDLQLGVAPPPLPDGGRKGSVALGTPNAWVGLSAKSKYPKEAVELLKALYSAKAGGYQAKIVGSGSCFSAVKGVNDKFLKDPQLMMYYKVYAQYGRFAPNPIIRNPQISKVYEEIKEVHPNLAELMQGTIVSSIKEPEKELKDYSRKSQAELARAVAAAQAKGAKVKISDFSFSSWDPMKDFTAKDYKKLK